jgi:hypothetical protein
VAAPSAGGTGQGTGLGNMLEDAAMALGGAVIRWEPVPDGSLRHLRVYIAYPDLWSKKLISSHLLDLPPRCL